MSSNWYQIEGFTCPECASQNVFRGLGYQYPAPDELWCGDCDHQWFSASPTVWGSYRGHLQHLFTPNGMSKCGTASYGEDGLTTPSKRKLCKKCIAIAETLDIPLPTVRKNIPTGD